MKSTVFHINLTFFLSIINCYQELVFDSEKFPIFHQLDNFVRVIIIRNPLIS